MPRSGAEARLRLQQAALDLYVEQGYDATTTGQISERAGLNHRTFFRHFSDKREVFFGGQDDLRDSFVASVTAEPDGVPAVTALYNAFLASAHVLEGNRQAAAPRLRIIAETPALLERDLAKGTAMAEALALALHSRGEPLDAAHLVGTVCWATFHHAATQWTATPERDLSSFITSAFTLLVGEIDQSSDIRP